VQRHLFVLPEGTPTVLQPVSVIVPPSDAFDLRPSMVVALSKPVPVTEPGLAADPMARIDRQVIASRRDFIIGLVIVQKLASL
jgi:hypothetical protein